MSKKDGSSKKSKKSAAAEVVVAKPVVVKADKSSGKKKEKAAKADKKAKKAKKAAPPPPPPSSSSSEEESSEEESEEEVRAGIGSRSRYRRPQLVVAVFESVTHGSRSARAAVMSSRGRVAGGLDRRLSPPGAVCRRGWISGAEIVGGGATKISSVIFYFLRRLPPTQKLKVCCAPLNSCFASWSASSRIQKKARLIRGIAGPATPRDSLVCPWLPQLSSRR